MQFVKTDDLKVGMRIARPIYNRDGVLLYERDSKLTSQGINSIRNFGLIGMFILEPAEPVPPMTAEDIEFERYQTVSVFAIQEELNRLLQTQKAQKIQMLVTGIIKNYGRRDQKINFIQNLRSKEDFIYKHVLNVAILSAMMAHHMRLGMEEQVDVVTAAIVHDIGKLADAKHLIGKETLTTQEEVVLHNAMIKGYEFVEQILTMSPEIKRYCIQFQKGLDCLKGDGSLKELKLSKASRVLMVAEMFDVMTAMQFGKAPDSPVKALFYLMEHEDLFGGDAVEALIKSIHILSPGVCVELNTGEKGVVVRSNDRNILRPVVLTFEHNELRELFNNPAFGDIEIIDIMRTLDNRYVMDLDLLRANGYLPPLVTKNDSGEDLDRLVEDDEMEQPEIEDEEFEEYVPGRDF